jgi:hypothetical protein
LAERAFRSFVGQGKGKGKGFAQARKSSVAMADGGTANDLDAMHQLLHIKLKVRNYRGFVNTLSME